MTPFKYSYHILSKYVLESKKVLFWDIVQVNLMTIFENLPPVIKIQVYLKYMSEKTVHLQLLVGICAWLHCPTSRTEREWNSSRGIINQL